jgi:hypothetical protein
MEQGLGINLQLVPLVWNVATIGATVYCREGGGGGASERQTQGFFISLYAGWVGGKFFFQE